MNPKKLLKEAGRSVGKLLSPKGDFPPLEELWPDVGGSCRIVRDEGWLHPAHPVDLSIIIPCYNNAPYLKAALDSVLGQQTRYRFEAVVIDDGSTDETPEVLSSYGNQPNVTLLRQENQGHSGARNAGIALSRGKYLLFHDSDDTLLPGSLEALMTCAEEQNADIVLGGYLCKDLAGNLHPGKSFPDGPVLDREQVPGMTCGKAFRRELWESLQFPLGYWYEDSVICQILLPMARKIYSVSTPIFAYLLNPQGVSAASQGKLKALESLYVTRRLLQERQAFGFESTPQDYTHFLHMVLLTYHRTRGLPRQVPYLIFEAQRQLQQTYFQGLSPVPPYEGLAQALNKGQFRRYLWLCETLWLQNRMGG